MDGNEPDYLKVAPQLNAFKSRVTEAEALFILPRESNYSPEIQALDTLRDTNFRGIRQVISGYTNHYDSQISAAANLLTKNIKLYGPQIAKLNYQAETSVITSMTKDWDDKPELTNAINVLNLKEWSVELKKNNTDFDTLYTQRTQEYGGRTQDKLKIKREEVAQAYLVLIENINARNTLDDTGMYTKVINELNALSDQYTNMLHIRKGRKGGDDADDTASED
ncbi:DUF6261 family protein [Flavobacterium sp. SM2513]|uniref:DUF6261 family protein n=1 Tax=Flavobacterium sp. SM2513 TaxID=3424766 RepID=UPI003D7F75C6